MATAARSAEPVPRRWRLRLPERLPDLKGRWLTLYSILWAILLSLSVIGAARGSYITLTTPTMWTPYGFSTTQDKNGVRVDAVTSSAVRSKGLKAGDYIVTIDSWPVPHATGRSEARPHVVKPDGSATIFGIQKPNGEVYRIGLVRRLAIEQEAYREAGTSRAFARVTSLGGAAVLPFIFITAAILLFIRRRREAVPAMLALSFLMFASIVNGGDLLGVNIGIVNIVGDFATGLLFCALFAFPSGRFEPRWTAVPFLLAILFTPIEPPPTIAFFVSAVFDLLVVVALVSRYKKVGAGAERQQLRWAFFGLVAGMLLLMISFAGNTAALAWQAEDPRWVVWQYAYFGALGPLSFGIMALGLIISILRYRLYDADAVIGQSAAYALLTIGFVALFAVGEKLIELLGQEYLGQNVGALAGGVAAALAAVAIAPMHARIHRWAERRFQKALYVLRHGLPLLVGDLRETSGLEQIAGATLDGLVDGVRASRAALIANDRLIDAREIAAEEVTAWWNDWMPAAHDGIDWSRSDPLFPVRVPLEAEGHGRVGWLLLGARPDGSLFGKSECDAIEEIAEPVARAVQVALRRQEREQQVERRLQNIEAAIAKLATSRRVVRPFEERPV
jgi:hypothetical protein